MYIEPNLELFQRSGENRGGNRFIIDVSSSWFVTAVVAACWMLQKFIDPASGSYVAPQEYTGDSFDGHNGIFLSNNGIPLHGRTGFDIHHVAWNGLDLIWAYVEWRNNVHQSTWIVGEGHSTHVIVYNTLAMLHNYNVLVIEDCHAKNGRTFGSATRFQKESPMRLVRDWPSMFDHVQPWRDIKSWPCEREDYFKNDPFVKGSNVTEIKVDTSEGNDTSFEINA